MEKVISCGLCGGDVISHCFSVSCPWLSCRKCLALGRLAGFGVVTSEEYEWRPTNA